MKKIDLKKALKHLYMPPANKVTVVDVPEMKFLMIDGRIEPGAGPDTSQSFQEAMQALYGMSYTLKFMSKLRPVDPIDYTVMALEGLWWVEEGEFSFEVKDNWTWTLMMLQPDHITGEMVAEALEKIREKQPDNPALGQLRFEPFHEGLSIQIMHIGPYAAEPATIEKMKAFAAEQGYVRRGRHHEIYIGDPRRAQPEKLKTVLRQPVAVA